MNPPMANTPQAECLPVNEHSRAWPVNRPSLADFRALCRRKRTWMVWKVERVKSVSRRHTKYFE